MWYLLALSLGLLAFNRPLSFTLLAASTLWGYCSGVIAWPMLVFMLVITLVITVRHYRSHSSWIRLSSEILLIAACLLLITHGVGGVQAIPVVDQVKLGPASAPFSFYYHFDKALIPYILVAIFPDLFKVVRQPLASRYWCLLIASIPGLLGLASLLGGLRLEPHLPFWLPSFLLANIFFVSLAEEALFRGYLQRRLGQLLSPPFALVGAALLFGGLHFAGGVMLMIFAGLAGMIYGLAWHWSGKLWVATGVHVSLNLVHLLFFTYPYAIHQLSG